MKKTVFKNENGSKNLFSIFHVFREVSRLPLGHLTSVSVAVYSCHLPFRFFGVMLYWLCGDGAGWLRPFDHKVDVWDLQIQV